MTPIADVENRTAVLDLEKVDESHTGIYSASYVGDSPLYSAWMRLIIRGNIFSITSLFQYIHVIEFSYSLLYFQ